MESSLSNNKIKEILNSPYKFKFIIENLLQEQQEKYFNEYLNYKDKTITKIIQLFNDNTRLKEKFELLCQGLTISSVLFLQQFRKKLLDKFSFKPRFMEVLIELTSKFIIEYPDSVHYLDSFENKKEKTANELLHDLSGKPNIIIANSHSVFKDAKTSWPSFVKEMKDSVRKEHEFIELPPFSQCKQVRLKDIITSIQIHRMQKKSLCSWKRDSFDHSYEKFHHIFNSKFNKILVQGEPGIGKSIQVKYLLHTWSSESSWDNENKILLLKIILRRVSNNQNLFNVLMEQNFKNISYMTEAVVESIIKEYKDQIFLLIDGADEFNITNHPLNEIIESNNSPVAVVIWSRNWKVEKIIDTSDVVFKLLGFSREQLEKFLKICIIDPETIKKFMDRFENHSSQMKNMCRVPILALAIYILFERENEMLNYSLFDIYNKTVQLINKNRGIPNSPLVKKMQRSCFENLHHQYALMELNNNEEIDLRSLIGEIIQILPANDSEKDRKKIQFYHLSY